jgi:hypothetical protein
VKGKTNTFEFSLLALEGQKCLLLPISNPKKLLPDVKGNAQECGA